MPVLLEVAVMFLCLEIHIWYFDRMGTITLVTRLMLIFLVFASWKMRGNTLRDLGLVPENWRSLKSWSHMFMTDLLPIVNIFFLLWIIIMSISDYVLPDMLFQGVVAKRFITSILLYYWGALGQQILMNGYFVNRLTAGISHQKLNILCTGILFGLVHLPNPVLTPITALGGMLSAYFFQRNKNVYTLALFHTILAVSIKYFLPHAWHHNLRIGPGFFSCCM